MASGNAPSLALLLTALSQGTMHTYLTTQNYEYTLPTDPVESPPRPQRRFFPQSRSSKGQAISRREDVPAPPFSFEAFVTPRSTSRKWHGAGKRAVCAYR